MPIVIEEFDEANFVEVIQPQISHFTGPYEYQAQVDQILKSPKKHFVLELDNEKAAMKFRNKIKEAANALHIEIQSRSLRDRMGALTVNRFAVIKL